MRGAGGGGGKAGVKGRVRTGSGSTAGGGRLCACAPPRPRASGGAVTDARARKVACRPERAGPGRPPAARGREGRFRSGGRREGLMVAGAAWAGRRERGGFPAPCLWWGSGRLGPGGRSRAVDGQWEHPPAGARARASLGSLGIYWGFICFFKVVLSAG